MELSACTNTRRPFVAVTPFPATSDAAPPPITETPWDQLPAGIGHLASVRYTGHVDSGAGAGKSTQVTASSSDRFSDEPWYTVHGSLTDAIAAARSITTPDGFDPAAANRAVAVLQAGEGTWQLNRLVYPEGMGDGMDAIISMPIDSVSAQASKVSVPYGVRDAGGFDRPEKVAVRFDDQRVAAVVGRDCFALAPLAT